MRLLVVDDDEQRADSLKLVLVSDYGFHADEITVCDCFDDARRLLRAQYFDGLVLDVVLPKRRGERAFGRFGLSLLEELGRNPALRKPERVIGITAYLDDIQQFRDVFLRHCFVVVEASPGHSGWRDQVGRSLSYLGASQLARVARDRTALIGTVHGIRTYGQWQSRLRRLIEAQTGAFSFFNYKYGYFPGIRFLTPSSRKEQIAALRVGLLSALEQHRPGALFLFGHSFGTLLIAEAVKKLVLDGSVIPPVTLIFSGSVLPEAYDWSWLERAPQVRVVNDCGATDTVLLLSEALVAGTGMAGRTGFLGYHRGKVLNRFFDGGHSSYFDGDEFMKLHWLPLVSSKEDSVRDFDDRSPAGAIRASFESFAKFLGRAKPWLSICVGLSLILGVIVMSVALGSGPRT